MKLRYFKFSQIDDILDVKNSPRFAIYPIKTKFSAFAHYYLICDVNLKNIMYQFNSPQGNGQPYFCTLQPHVLALLQRSVTVLYTVFF